MRRFLFLAALAAAQLQADNEVWLGAGYRQDQFDWSISGSDGTPDVMSELSWKNLRMAEVSFGAKGELFCIGAYRINADYAWILSGSNRDSDYAGNNKTIEYSRSCNKASKGEAFDLKIGLGHTYKLFCDSFTITPLAGYAQMEQHLTMYDGFQEIDLIHGFHGHFEGLHSRYNTRWESPWVGVDFTFDPTECFSLFGSFEMHFPFYKAKGHWNLRTDFIGDFVHKGNGRGYWYTLGGKWRLFSGLTTGLIADASFFKVTKGHDTTKFAEVLIDQQGNIIGEEVITGTTHIHAVHWDSYRIQAFVSYEF